MLSSRSMVSMQLTDVQGQQDRAPLSACAAEHGKQCGPWIEACCSLDIRLSCRIFPALHVQWTLALYLCSCYVCKIWHVSHRSGFSNVCAASALLSTLWHQA